jgi:hypothetical protein
LPYVLANISKVFVIRRIKEEKRNGNSYTLSQLYRNHAGWTLFKAQMVHRNEVNGLEN